MKILDFFSEKIVVVDGKARIVHANAAWHEGELDGGDYVAICADESTDTHELARKIERVASGGSASEHCLIRCPVEPDDRWFRAEMTPLPVDGQEWVLIRHHDVTPEKQAEEALQVSERRHQRFVETIPYGIFQHTADGIITYANPAGHQLLGYPPGELRGTRVWEHAADETTRDRVLRTVAFDPETSPTSGASSLLLRTGDGRNLNARIDWSYLGEQEGFVSAVTDATEQTRTLQALRESETLRREVEQRHRLESQLRQSQKLESLGQLAGGIAHDFNNLLTAILGNAENVLVALDHEIDVATKQKAGKGLREIQRAADRASSLTRQLLEFSRNQIITPEILDPNRIVTDLDRMLRRLIGEHITLELELAEEPVNVLADAGQFGQVVMNLVLNSRDAMPGGGWLTLATRRVEIDADHTALYPDATPGPHLQLTVSDTGIGMAEEVRRRVFDPFFTTKPVGKGTGLGLATVYGIVRQAGGHLTVSSEPGSGSTFSVFLPIVDGEAATEHVAVAAAASAGDEVVLICEDDDGVRNVTRQVLEAGGYRVLEGDCGEQALKIADEHEGAIDLLITDVIMPGINGRELAENLTNRQPELAVLFVSGYTAEMIDVQKVQAAGNAFLQKPFSPTSLLRRVREVLD